MAPAQLGAGAMATIFRLIEMKPLKISLLIVAASALGFAVVGCDSGGGPDPKVEQNRVNSAVEMRKLFDNVGGDYSKLSSADKAKFEKYSGGPAEAEKTWQLMKVGPSGMSSNPNGQ